MIHCRERSIMKEAMEERTYYTSSSIFLVPICLSSCALVFLTIWAIWVFVKWKYYTSEVNKRNFLFLFIYLKLLSNRRRLPSLNFSSVCPLITF